MGYNLCYSYLKDVEDVLSRMVAESLDQSVADASSPYIRIVRIPTILTDPHTAKTVETESELDQLIKDLAVSITTFIKETVYNDISFARCSFAGIRVIDGCLDSGIANPKFLADFAIF